MAFKAVIWGGGGGVGFGVWVFRIQGFRILWVLGVAVHFAP